jgi:DNA-directed RNA polymerase II subunit RPB1
MIEEPIIKNVNGLQFSIMSPDEIRSQSVVEVTKNETYDKDIPVIKGLFDLRMGTTDMGKICNTCGLKNSDCPGHFGHLELARPVYYYHFIDIVIKLLKCVCFKCSKLLINTDSPIIMNLIKKDNKTRWSEIYNLCSNVSRCGQETEDGCGCLQPKRYKLDGINGIQASWKDTSEGEITSQYISAEYVKSLFEKISDKDCNILGFSSLWCRPEWLICSVLPIPPPAVRPSVKQGSSQRMDDDLTHKLSDIIKFNNILKKQLEKSTRKEIIDDWTNQVQYHIATYIDNELPSLFQSTHRSGRPIKSIRQRLKGKEGRVRNNLMGKRVDFSARSVITPDPNIELDELGVPIKIAVNLTYPEVVNDFNKIKLSKLIKNGPNIWPGVNSIEMKNGKKLLINDNNINSIEIKNGDIVHRHLIDGDYVLFNRQPSLHKMSMMGHKVKVMKGNTFRLNVSVTPPYNADFDGDEMNMHVPQSIHSVIELINIASVKKHIISPRENKPIITIVQDTLLGIYKLTHSHIIKFSDGLKQHHDKNGLIYEIEDSKSDKCVSSSMYTKSQMMNIISDLSTYNGKTPDPDKYIMKNEFKIPLWSGHNILSYILSENINLELPNSSYDNFVDKESTNSESPNSLISKYNKEMNIVNIKNGDIKKGTFDKNLFTKTSKGLIHTIFNDSGKEKASEFINDLQKIVSYILQIEGFSVGISDMIADDETNNKIKETINERKKMIEEIMQELHLDIFSSIPGQSKEDYKESKINSILNKTINDTGKIGLENLDPNNRAIFMVNSGSKGKLTNVAQMVACLGQQNVDGKRIPHSSNDRTLPHYYKHDDSAESRGFVSNSFISGQTPQEFFFHAMGGREGLIDTAVKTSTTGYVQRQLVKSMEDLKVGYDYSVRDGSGSIVQYIYGDDGMNAACVESQPLYVTKYDEDKIAEMFYFGENTDWNKILKLNTKQKLEKISKYQEKLNDNFKMILNHREYLISEIFDGEPENNINFPVHIERIIMNETSSYSNKSKSNMHPLEIIKENNKLIKRCYISNIFKNNKIFKILIDIHMNPKILIQKYNINKESYMRICEIIFEKYNESKIMPGEMVGCLAAQSIGEPATQMTLNTFHFAGVSAKSNVTRGIPRLKELIHVSKNIKSPSVIINIKDDYSTDKNKATFIKNQLEYTLLKDIVTTSKIYYDPKDSDYNSVIEEDNEFLEIYKEFSELSDDNIDDILPWIIRINFNKNVMMEKGITMEDIYISIMNYDSEKILYHFTDDNYGELIGRISLKMKNDYSSENGIQDQSDIINIFKNINEDMMNNIVIRGIKNITNIIITEDKILNKINYENKNVTNYSLITDGTNLIDILNNEYINPYTSISNDISEIYKIFGIEGARMILTNEINDVIKHEGEYINSRHIDLLCDTMTNKGELYAINRQGINKNDSGPLAKCSFEDTTDQLIKSSIFSEKDNLDGVSSNIMLGQLIKSGTGFSEILLDEEKLISNLKDIDHIEDEYLEVDESNIDIIMDVEEKEEDENINCKDEDFKFSNE